MQNIACGKYSLSVKRSKKLKYIGILSEFETVKNISSIPVKNAIFFLEEEYNLFLEGHTHWVRSIAITSDNKSIVSGGRDKNVQYGTSKIKYKKLCCKAILRMSQV